MNLRRRRRTASLIVMMVALTASLSAAAEPTGPEPPPPWSHKDIGDIAVKGDARLRDGVFAVTGTLDIWTKADGFHFVYQPHVGDGQIIARVTRVENTNHHAKAGVMIRESLDPGARHATLVVTADDGTQFLKRKETDDVTTVAKTGRDLNTFPYWVKLVRKGDTFTASESSDGTTWTLVGTETLKLPTRCYVGLVASSHQKTVTNTSTLDHVTINQP